MIIFDVEANGLLDVADTIHVMSWYNIETGEEGSTKNYDTMRHMLTTHGLIGHNIVTYDIPLVEKLLGIKVEGTIIDTLPLSWYLEPQRIRHGLDDWGKTLGVEKPKIDDWDSLTYEEYRHRCEEDVKINHMLWKRLERKLRNLYRDEGERQKLIDYLTFKMECARDQEAYGWKLDVAGAEALLADLQQQKEDKELELRKAMPQKPITKVMNPPKIMTKKDGELSSRGEAWLQTLRENYLPISTNTPITVLVGHEEGNPNSNEQVKAWLFDLGWIPRTYKFVRGEAFGEERKIPQVRNGSDLCDSVVDLVEEHPAVGLLDGLTVINHRLGIVKGFVEMHKDGWLVAGIAGLTNTFRFKHRKPLVNLPAVDKPYGKEIRGLLTAPEGVELCGSDMVSLEDNTKRHYMKPLDPEYVEEMSCEGFDPHLDLAKHAGAVTQADIDRHTSGEIDLSALRKGYKAANYACVYGVGPATLSRQTGMTQGEAKKLIDAYWKRNWAVKKAADSQRVREIDGQMWIRNPLSGFWHNLRYEKDRWSTLNQSSGVYCFDSWVRKIKAQGVRVIGQFHDEVCCEITDRETTTKILKEAIQEVNIDLNMNVPLDVDVQFGNNYAEIH